MGRSQAPHRGNKEHRSNDSSKEPYLPPTPGDNTGYLDENQLTPNPRDKASPSPHAAIPLRDYLQASPNFLAESSCSSLSLDSCSSGRLVSYPWEVSVGNPLPRPFASVGMPPPDIVEEPNQDPILSNGLARSNLEDGPSTHYVDPSF